MRSASSESDDGKGMTGIRKENKHAVHKGNLKENMEGRNS